MVRRLPPIALSVALVLMASWLAIGTGRTGAWVVPVRTLRSQEPVGLTRLRDSANRLWMAGEYEKASGLYRQGYERAVGRRETASAVRFLNNLAGCRFALSQHQKAVEEYLEARRLARSIGFTELLGTISVNLAGLYLNMGDASAAAQAAEKGVRDLEGIPDLPYRARLLVQLGNARVWSGQVEAGLATLSESRREADRTNDLPMLALSFDYEGNYYLGRGDTGRAESAFLRGFLVRRLRKPDEAHYSYANLGRLRLAQGDAPSATRLFDQALAQAKRALSPVQLWTIYNGRGNANLAQGRIEEALSDLGNAVELARRWRADAVAVDALRIHTDAGLREIYQSYIEAGNQAALHGGRPDLARAAFSVSEEHRAVSLRERWSASGEWRRRLPEEYWTVLGQLQSAEVTALRDPSSAAASRAAQLRLRLIEMEAATGAPRPPIPQRGADFSRSVQRKLGPSEALLSFELGGKNSYLWTVTREEFALHPLGPSGKLTSLIARFRDAVRLGEAGAGEAGRELYSALFGSLGPLVRGKSSWILVLDDALFGAPLAASVTGIRKGLPVYLVESHSLLTIPSAAAVLEVPDSIDEEPRRLFVGVGDPVYNAADPRTAGTRETGSLAPLGLALIPPLRASASSPPELELPRLVGSAAEIRECSRRWGGQETVLLEGPAANRARLAEALGRRPAVVHLATHVLTPAGRQDAAVIVLSLRPPGSPEVLTSSEIASLGAGRLVVLSGCSSGAGAPMPGAGLVGLTRAWLAAGASRVVASLWPTPDNSGEIFLSFYRHISLGTQDAAEALRKAQLEMSGSGNWRREPRYWAAYVVTGKR